MLGFKGDSLNKKFRMRFEFICVYFVRSISHSSINFDDDFAAKKRIRRSGRKFEGVLLGPTAAAATTATTTAAATANELAQFDFCCRSCSIRRALGLQSPAGQRTALPSTRYKSLIVCLSVCPVSLSLSVLLCLSVCPSVRLFEQ